MYLYRHKFLTLLLSLSSVCAHDLVDPLEHDQAQTLYELTHQLIQEYHEKDELLKQKAQTILLRELQRLEDKKTEESRHKQNLENELCKLRQNLAKDTTMHSLNTTGRNTLAVMTVGAIAIGAALKITSHCVSAQTATYYFDDPSSIAFYITIPFVIVASGIHYLKVRDEHSVAALEQKIATKESDLKRSADRIFDLETEINNTKPRK